MRLDKAALFEDLEYKPHEGQKPVHASTAPRRVVACGVRWGKTRCAAMEGLAAALTPAKRSYGWTVAPTYELSEKVFREIVIVAAEHLRHRIVSLREHDQKLVLRNMGGGLSEIKGKSADNPVSLLGEGLDWLIVDEAARLKPSIWEGFLTQRLIDRNGWALLISTPKGKGWFYEAYRRGQGRDADFESWNEPSWRNPHLNAEKIDAERARLPDRVFRQEFGAEFVEGTGAVFRNVRECARVDFQAPMRDEIYVAGLDLARTHDFTVLVILNAKKEVVFADRFTRLDWATQVGRIKAALDRFNNASVVVDSTGAGEPIFEQLREEGISVEPYSFTQRSKAALVNNLALMLEQSEIALPRADAWPELIEELEAFEYAITENGATRTGAPTGMHDDCVIALALAAWNATRSFANGPFIVWI